MAPAARVLSPLPLLDEGLFLNECEERGINTKHAYTMWRHIIAKGVTNVRDIPELPHKLYDLVEEKFALSTSTLVSHTTSEDGSTTKMLIKLQDGAEIETVIMRYGRFELRNFPKDKQRKTTDGKTKFVSNERATVCVSSQVGCQMGCTFCATGTMGLMSNLTAGEILEQLYHANTIEPIRNVVFMGMGEPLDNYDAVVMAVRGMTDVQRFSLSPSRIAVSTVGVVPKMKQLAEDCPEIGLAVSLHAPTQDLRTQIVPTAKAWHINKIVQAMDHFLEQRARVTAKKSHILVEYVLIDDVNSSEDVAHDLGQLLQGRDVIINVIPYNPTDVPFDYKPPPRETVDAFNDVLREYDLRTIVRQELGQDVNAACGQLVISSQKQQQKEQGGDGSVRMPKGATTDIEDLIKRANTASSSSSSTLRNRYKRKNGASSSSSKTTTRKHEANTAATATSPSRKGKSTDMKTLLGLTAEGKGAQKSSSSRSGGLLKNQYVQYLILLFAVLAVLRAAVKLGLHVYGQSTAAANDPSS